MIRLALTPLLLTLACVAPAQAERPVQGAGASFPSKVYQRWTDSYAQAGQVKVVYKPTGSGDGVQQITERKAMFGGTDSPLSAEELSKRKLVQLPTVIGGVVPVVKLPGVAANQLNLSGELLADLFAGKVIRWNDARIAALNPGLRLPDLPVRRVVRAEKSGSTEAFTKYLALMSVGFKAEVGAGQLPKWPGETLRGEGNDGMVRQLQATEGAIAYVSYDRVVKDRLVGVRLRNAEGRFVGASEAGFRAAVRESDLHRKGDDTASVLNQAGADSWPITLTSFVLFDAEPDKAVDVNGALHFFYWAFQRGDRLFEGTGFAPLPLSVKAKLAARFMAVHPRDGQPLKYLQI